MSRIAAIITAAGLSSRMGDFKPLLKVGAETMLIRTIRRMEAVSANPIIVVTGYMHEQIEEHLIDENVVCVHNKTFKSTHMLDSLLLGLKEVQGRCDYALISPVDIAVTDHDTVRKIAECTGEFVRPSYMGMAGHPVLLKMSHVNKISSYKGAGGLQGAIENNGIPITEILVDDMGIIMDADTKGDYAKVLGLWRQKESRCDADEWSHNI